MAWRVTSGGTVQSTRILPVEEIMFGDYFDRIAAQHPEKTAIVDTETGQQYTYDEVLRIGKSIAAVLQERGVKPRDLVVLCGMTGVKACCYILALVLCQVTMVTTKHFYSVYEFQDVLKNFPSLKLVIGDNASASKLRLASSVEVLNLEENWSLTIHRAGDFKHPGAADPRSSMMLMCLTSGSTGPSKAVCMSHYSTMGMITQWTSTFARFLMYNPISHLSGLLCFLMTLARVETLYVAPETLKDDVDKYLSVCSQYRIESSLAMPALFTSLTNYGATDKLASVKYLSTGGSAIPQPLVDEFRSLHPHIRVEVLYGTSELGGVVMRSEDPSSIHRLTVLPNVEAKVVDLEGDRILGRHQNGELHCKAPSIALGYYNDQNATIRAFIDGWQVTGDLAYRDDDGRFVVVDRLKQLIKCMDSQVAPADLELLLSQDADVLKVVVGGVPHEKYGEAAVAFVVPRKRSNLVEFREKLLTNLESKCSFHKRLHGGLFFVSEIPETDSGKFSRREIVDKHLNKALKYLY